MNGLTLAPHTARRPGRTHDGVVVALRLNVRWWCSNHLKLHCRYGAIVRVLFAIDACDREIMGWLATTAGACAEMVCDNMIACVECRFCATKAPHTLKWLSDNSFAYIAKGYAQTAAARGLRLLFTPVRSPQSKSIAEAFVKTLKRDYARLAILPDAEPSCGFCRACSRTTTPSTRTSACACSSPESSSAGMLEPAPPPVPSDRVRSNRSKEGCDLARAIVVFHARRHRRQRPGYSGPQRGSA